MCILVSSRLTHKNNKKDAACRVRKMTTTTTKVEFQLNHNIENEDDFYICGSSISLGNWNIDNSLKLEKQTQNLSIISIELPCDTEFEYKYLLKSSNQWEKGSNRKRSIANDIVQVRISPFIELYH